MTTIDTQREGRAVLDVLERFKRAIFTKDAEALVALYADDARIFDFWGTWSYDGVTPWRASVEKWFGSLGEVRDVATFSEVRTLVDGDLAVVHAFVRFAAIAPDGLELRGMDERVSWALRKQDSAWKIAHQHTSAPIRGETMQPVLQRGGTA